MVEFWVSVQLLQGLKLLTQSTPESGVMQCPKICLASLISNICGRFDIGSYVDLLVKKSSIPSL